MMGGSPVPPDALTTLRSLRRSRESAPNPREDGVFVSELFTPPQRVCARRRGLSAPWYEVASQIRHLSQNNINGRDSLLPYPPETTNVLRGRLCTAKQAFTALRSLLLVVVICDLSHRAESSFQIDAVTDESPLLYAGMGTFYSKVNDACGLCNGDTTICQGCDRIPNSDLLFDACGQCLNRYKISDKFNETCVHCVSIGGDTATNHVHDHQLFDDCSVCREPTGSIFSREGIPDEHSAGCIGCDGLPNSGGELDACGVCGGHNCPLYAPDTHSWCCDCGGVPFGYHIINFCCECVDRVEHWADLSNGMYHGPPLKHSLAEYFWASGRSAIWNGKSELNRFIESESVLKSSFNRSNTVYSSFQGALDHFNVGWQMIRDLASDDNSACYTELYSLNIRSNPRDICGLCGGDNHTCLGCGSSVSTVVGRPIPDGGLLTDDCGVCGGDNSAIDECGLCFGGNETCTGCDGVPNSGKTLDDCFGSDDVRYLNFIGQNGEVGSGCSSPDDFKEACDRGMGGCCGCDGVPNSGKIMDGCDACQDNRDNGAQPLMNASCSGCDGVRYSERTYDACCICGGDNNHTSQCYLDVLVDGKDSKVPFDPYTMDYHTYFTSEGQALFDKCGECQGWGYNGSTCIGCDGIHGSGLTTDGCGVCGGDCSTCRAFDNGFPYDCSSPGRGWTGMDRWCVFVRTNGAVTVDAWTEWTVLPNGTDADGVHAISETWYEAVNMPGASTFIERAKGECRMFLEPSPPLSTRKKREWVVKVLGKEEGPYTLPELESGSIPVLDTTTGEKVSTPLLPTTLVAKIATEHLQQSISYGLTSQYPSRVKFWQERTKGKIVRSPAETGILNTVLVDGFSTKLKFEGIFLPVASMPDMEHIIYPYCTGSSWRGDKHRLHGKKIPGNYLGILTTEEIVDEVGLLNGTWNPLSQYIYDVSTGWIDQKCTCSSTWEYESAPIPPTCLKAWFPWSVWLEGQWHNSSITNNVAESFAVNQVRSWSGGGWRVSGGWWMQDYGGGGARQYDSYRANVYNAYGQDGDHGYGQLRGPFRIDATGILSVKTVSPSFSDLDGTTQHNKCYSAARISQPQRNSSGAVWSDHRENVTGGWKSSFVFIVSSRAEQCTSVQTVSRSFTNAIHTHSHGSCSPVGGDGFAFVIRDDTSTRPTSSDVGTKGPGLGYQGLRHSLAVEFDTWHNHLHAEPYEPHVAVHTNGPNPNQAHHEAHLCSTIDLPSFTDGLEHEAVITYTPDVTWEAIASSLESGSFTGASSHLSHFIGERPRLFNIYVDNMELPLLSVPLTIDTVLRSETKSAWVGFTSGTGDTWQVIDVISWNFTSFS